MHSNSNNPALSPYLVNIAAEKNGNRKDETSTPLKYLLKNLHFRGNSTYSVRFFLTYTVLYLVPYFLKAYLKYGEHGAEIPAESFKGYIFWVPRDGSRALKPKITKHYVSTMCNDIKLRKTVLIQ